MIDEGQLRAFIKQEIIDNLVVKQKYSGDGVELELYYGDYLITWFTYKEA